MNTQTKIYVILSLALIHISVFCGAANVALNKSVTLSGTFWGTGGSWGPGTPAAASTVVDGVFKPRSHIWNASTVFWADTLECIVEVNLGSYFAINDVIVQVDDNDTYALDGWNGANWVTLYDMPAVGGSGMQTRPNPADDSQKYHLSQTYSVSKLRVHATGGDGFYSVSEIQAFGEQSGEGSDNGNVSVNNPGGAKGVKDITTGDPIAPAGNFYYLSGDLAPSVTLPSLQLLRSYNSFDADVGVYGRGWMHNYQARIESGTCDVVRIRGDGKQETYLFTNGAYRISGSEHDGTLIALGPTNLLRNMDFERVATNGWATNWIREGNISRQTGFNPPQRTNSSAYAVWEGTNAGGCGSFSQEVQYVFSSNNPITFSIWGYCQTNFASSNNEAYIRMEFWFSPVSKSYEQRWDIYPVLTARRNAWRQYTVSWANTNPAITLVRAVVGSGQWTPSGGTSALVAWDNASLMCGAQWQFIDLMNQSFDYDGAGRLMSIADANSNRIQLVYSTTVLTNVLGTLNRSLTFAYSTADLLTNVSDWAGRSVAYNYTNRNGQVLLKSARDVRGNLTTYQYDTNGFLSVITDPQGNAVVSNVYDGLGRVVTQYDALGNRSDIRY